MTTVFPPVIGLVGFPTHGKSTAQRFLSHMGVEARDDAEVLRQRVMDEYNLTLEDVTTQAGKLKTVSGINGEPMTVRQLLGDYGQIFGEQLYGPNYWVELALQKLREDRVEHPVSFGSLRRSQPAAVKAAGGYIIEILDPRKPVGPLHYFDEFDRDDVDVIVFNDSNEGDLAVRMLQAVQPYLQLDLQAVRRFVRAFI
jgi:hypothetical protein